MMVFKLFRVKSNKMKWKIIDTINDLEADIMSNMNFLIGSSENCDIKINEEKFKSISYQVFLDNNFVFLKNNYNNIVKFKECNIKINNKQIFLKTEKYSFVLIPSEQEISKIFRSQEFKITLSYMQNLLSQCNYNKFENNENNIINFINLCCEHLNTFFWKNEDIHKETSRKYFQKIIWCLWAQVFEHGILTFVLQDPTISEIMVNSDSKIYLEKSGVISLSELQYESSLELLSTIERICNKIGRRIDQHTPFCDARLPDGSRVHAIIPPLAITGPCLTIRKFPKKMINFLDLVQLNTIPKNCSKYLEDIVRSKKNILISGGTGTGKTTLLNCLSAFINNQERIITIEDSAELQLQQPHVIRLECRNANIENQGQITIRDLLKNTLRMRPDRIIIGECRGLEALDMLQAMNTGHEGSMTTIHANSASDALRRLETLVLFAAEKLPSHAIREQIASAIHVVIQLSRNSHGSRFIKGIYEVKEHNENTNKIVLTNIYED